MSDRRSSGGGRPLLWKAIRVVLGVGGALGGAAVVVGSLLMRGFMTGHGGPDAETGDTTVFAVIGVFIAVLCPLAASSPSRLTIGAAAASVLALFVAAGVV